MIQASSSAEAQQAGAQSERAALTQRLAEADLSRGYVLTAPIDGVVTGLTARLGQPASGEQPLMLVVPAGARPQAELYVPSAQRASWPGARTSDWRWTRSPTRASGPSRRG